MIGFAQKDISKYFHLEKYNAEKSTKALVQRGPFDCRLRPKLALHPVAKLS
jgi:hypothetical protein